MDQNDVPEADAQDQVEVVPDTDTDVVEEEADYKAKYEEEARLRREEAGRRKRAETNLQKVRINSAVERKVDQVLSKHPTGELDDMTLDYLDVKGFTEPADIEVIHTLMKKTGLSAREAIKDDWALAKIQKLRETREVKAATPSATKRSGNSLTNDVSLWLAKIEGGHAQLSDIPDFNTRAAVVDARGRKDDTKVPPWHR